MNLIPNPHLSYEFRENQKWQNILGQLKPFYRINVMRFWIELFSCAVLGWMLFFFSVWSSLFSLQQIIFFSLATLLIYRGQVFIHEISHFRYQMKNLEIIYNLLLGYPNRMPSYVYYPHVFHHARHTFGSKHDPEYLCFKGKSIYRVFSQCFFVAALLPLLQIIRWGLIPVFYPFLGQKQKKFIFQRMSTLVLNPFYIRPFYNNKDLRKMVFHDTWVMIYLYIFLIALSLKWIPIVALFLGYFLTFISHLLNMFRAKINHTYTHLGTESAKIEEQLNDTVTVDSYFCELWAPLGLSFHTVHHLAPTIPYHNLKAAHRFLFKTLELNHPYMNTLQPSYFSAAKRLGQLWKSKSFPI